MSPRKLTEADKQEILDQYRNSGATTSTLAVDYGVSSSTISRFLKNKLSQSEYEDLIQQKRLARTPRGEKSTSSDSSKRDLSEKNQPQSQPELQLTIQELEKNITETISAQEREITRSETSPLPIRRRRSRAITSDNAIATDNTKEESLLEENKPDTYTPTAKPTLNENKERRRLLNNESVESEEEDDALDVITLGEILGEDIEDIDDEDDDEEDDDDWEVENDGEITYPHAESRDFDVRILPLSAASFPRTCYLVIDRSAELIVKPLEDFADLGSIPETEIQQQTLPVFDNHRIAKRFSHRRERVIKVPDGKMLQKTSRYLQAKGITRLLLDGQIYSLSNDF
jgi:transposase-like protein